MVNQTQINWIVFAVQQTLAPSLADECVSAFAETIKELVEFKKEKKKQEEKSTPEKQKELEHDEDGKDS